MPDSALSQFVVPVSLSVGDGAEFSAFLHEMAAKKLDIRFRPLPGGAPGALAATLELDGVAVSSETNAAATSQRTWRLSVAHPRNPHSATGSFSAATNFVHCLVCGFDGMSADGLVAESSRAADAATSNLLFRAAYSPFGEDWGHGGVNLYAYAAGDPLSYIDPLGLCPESTTYSRVFTAGIRGAIVFGGGIELGFAVDSDGRLGLVGKASAGFGMEVAAKNPITDTIASALSEPFLKSAGPSAGKASGTIYDLMGFEPESHASFFVGVTSDLKTSPITGVEFGNIGGGVYETGTLVLPIWDPVFVRKTFDWIKERAKAVADWF